MKLKRSKVKPTDPGDSEVEIVSPTMAQPVCGVRGGRLQTVRFLLRVWTAENFVERFHHLQMPVWFVHVKCVRASTSEFGVPTGKTWTAYSSVHW